MSAAAEHTAPAEPLTCLVADDHAAVIEAVCPLLAEQGIEVVGRSYNSDEALQLIRRQSPRTAIVDLRLPLLGGIEVARRAARSSPRTGVVLYAASCDRGLVLEAMDAGVRGFVLTEAPVVDLVVAVQTVGRGGTYLDPTILSTLLDPGAGPSLSGLTRRERDVLRLLADGYSNDGIGTKLALSPETVRSHLRKAMRKLDANTRAQAVATALRRSLIT